MKFGSRVNRDEISPSIDVNAISRMPRTNDVRRILLAVYGIAIFSSQSIADSPYENAAKLDMEHLASSILAASVCSGVRFNGDVLVTSLTAAFVLLGRKRTEDAFFSAMSANIDEMSAKGKEAWCTATIKAAKERNSEMLTED
jgi:hypothetical protein